VSIGAAGMAVLPSQMALIAFAGPLLNLVLFIVAWASLKQKRLKRNTFIFLHVTKQINLFLFVFNMLPIPLFDGWKVYQGFFQAF
jgi:Zn-dependent protease